MVIIYHNRKTININWINRRHLRNKKAEAVTLPPDAGRAILLIIEKTTPSFPLFRTPQRVD